MAVVVVDGDAHGKVFVNQRVEADEEPLLGIDAEEESYVHASAIPTYRVRFIPLAGWIAEPDLGPSLPCRTVASLAPGRRERVDKQPVSMSPVILSSEVHRRQALGPERAEDQAGAALDHRLFQELHHGSPVGTNRIGLRYVDPASKLDHSDRMLQILAHATPPALRGCRASCGWSGVCGCFR